MGPVGTTARVRAAYAFGVLAGRSARQVSPSALQGAGIALLQMIVDDNRRTRIAGSRVAGYVFAAPIDGGPAPVRPNGLAGALVQQLNQPNDDEQEAAMEALGLLREIAVLPTLTDVYQRARSRNDGDAAAAALEALTRIGDPSTRPLVAALAGDSWGSRRDEAGLVVAYARARFLQDGSVDRLRDATDDRRLGARARAYLAELGQPVP
ncbi:MAG: HEAT repeat domain-containing protein [Vicinamibacterales bacterium]